MKKHEKITKYLSPEQSKLEAKIGGDSYSNGVIMGYGSVFGVRDQDNDIVVQGAFSRAISNQIAARSVPLMVKHFAHGGDVMESIGVITEAKEDDIGLWIVAELDGTEESQKVRKKIMSNPGIFGMSIGFLNSGEGFRVLPEGGRELNEINLKEVTVTLMPSNASTLGTLGAKTEGGLEEILNGLSERIGALEAKLTDDSAEDSDGAGQTEETATAEDSDNALLIARIKRTLSILEN